MQIINFIKNHYIECAVGLCLFIALTILIICLIVKRVKRRHRDKLERILDNIPIMPDEEDEEEFEGQSERTRKGDADLKWLREQTFGADNDKATTDEKNESEDETMKKAKEEKKTVKAPAKTTAKVEKTTAKETKTTAKTVKAEAKAPAKMATKKAVGKWVIREKGEGEFVAFLHANNGEIMLTSEIYASADGARKGVSTIQKSATGDGFQIYCDKNRNYYFKLKNSKNRFLCVGETYPTRGACISAVESVKRFVDAPISETVEKDLTQIVYVVPKDEKVEKKSGYAGKWVIIDVDDMYIAQLFASNGELLLSSEAYTTVSSAKSSIETITANGLQGNFIIDADKKGRYFFKLRNSQKSTLCVGETYSQLAKCQSAIESVRRFLKTAKLEVSDGE